MVTAPRDAVDVSMSRDERLYPYGNKTEDESEEGKSSVFDKTRLDRAGGKGP